MVATVIASVFFGVRDSGGVSKNWYPWQTTARTNGVRGSRGRQRGSVKTGIQGARHSGQMGSEGHADVSKNWYPWQTLVRSNVMVSEAMRTAADTGAVAAGQ